MKTLMLLSLLLAGCQPVGAPTLSGPIDHAILNFVTIGNTPTLTPTVTTDLKIPLGGLGVTQGLTGDAGTTPGYTICGTCSISDSAPPAASEQLPAPSLRPGQRRKLIRQQVAQVTTPQGAVARQPIDPELQRRMDEEWRAIWAGVAARRLAEPPAARQQPESVPEVSQQPPTKETPPAPPKAPQRWRF
jgi:hypothetical protein